MEGNDELLALFVRYQRAKGLSLLTVQRRRWSLGALAALVDPLPIVATTSADLEELLLRWSSPQTRRSARSDIHVFFQWAIRRGLAGTDPTSVIDAPKVPKRAPTPVRPEDVHLAIDQASGDLRLMILLAAYAGLRVSEIAAFRGRDVQPHRGLLVVRNGKGAKDGEVALAPELGRALAGCTSGRLFPGVSGDAVSARIKAHFVRLGIEGRPHDLRASFATEVARRSNGNVVAVRMLMRHESTQTTERYMGFMPDTAALVTRLYE